MNAWEEAYCQGEPAAINEQGTKFWFHKELTKYANNQKGMPNVVVLFVKAKDEKNVTRLWVVDNLDGSILKEFLVSQWSLEGIGVWLDMISIMINGRAKP